MIVSPARRMLRAISLGVFWRSAPSTSAIMRSRKVWPGSEVICTLIWSESTSEPGQTFLDRMIALVEGAERQKTPNEIALNILLAGLTIIFLIVVVTLQPFAIYSDAAVSVTVLIALLVCLIPTTIGGLLAAIGIAGMDRHVRHNVLAILSLI